MNLFDSNYIFYADESGDHSLTSIDPTYPVFALSLCAFRKSTYCTRIVPKFQNFKFKYFGHDSIVLHEHEIRKQKNDFRILNDQDLRKSFMADLNNCVESSKFKIFSTVIQKEEISSDLFPENPYKTCLKICLQNSFIYLERQKETDKRTHFIFEKRGTKEDNDLELEFRRIISGENDLRIPFPNFVIHFSDKRTNSTGMQIADLTARPLGLRILRPDQNNRAYNLIQKKIFGLNHFFQPGAGIYNPK